MEEIKLYNTLNRKKQVFKPKRKEVGLYTCGPTVYHYAHIGNLRSYLFSDTLKRVLNYNNYNVKHVMNITDVGHLTSDADTGEDKLEKGAKREKKTVWSIAEFYTKHFKKDLKNLNIKAPSVWIKATDTIKEQIDLIKQLEKKGFTYNISDGVYFDTSKLKNYGILWGNKIELKKGCRVKMGDKKHPTDFALWKISKEKRQMEWDSPWGKGFPGWHTECVVMSIQKLGVPFDIHCGGIDHIQVHHTNEIAQSQALFKNNLANFWMHNDFVIQKKSKMSKSKGNIITLDSLIKKGFSPLSFRYFCLTAHYRSKLSFSEKNLISAQNSFNNLKKETLKLKNSNGKDNRKKQRDYRIKFIQIINNDLDTPKSLALVWDLLKDKTLSNQNKYNLIIEFDKVFGLNLKNLKKDIIPEKIKKLVAKRNKMRKDKNFKEADCLRKEIETLGYNIEDKEEGSKISKLTNIVS